MDHAPASRDTALASFARRADPVRGGEHGAASLFVDDGGAPTSTIITFNISGVATSSMIQFILEGPATRTWGWPLAAPPTQGLRFRSNTKGAGTPITLNGLVP